MAPSLPSPPAIDSLPLRATSGARRLGRSCRYVVPLVLWMAFVFTMSTRVGSSANTASLLSRLLEWFRPDLLRELSPDRLDLLNYLIRKLGHVTEYAVLTVLAVRAFQQDRRRWRWPSGCGGVALSLLYAGTDEWHQRFVAGRTGMIADVGVDAIGITLAMACCWLWYRGSRSLPEELALLAQLRDRGALTDEEYARAKNRAIGK